MMLGIDSWPTAIPIHLLPSAVVQEIIIDATNFTLLVTDIITPLNPLHNVGPMIVTWMLSVRLDIPDLWDQTGMWNLDYSDKWDLHYPERWD
jgi:hypothetical protein